MGEWGESMNIVLVIILTVAAVGQIILSFVLYNPEGNVALINAGWGVMALSAIFGWLPIYTFRRWGKVKGRGYIRTTVLVDKGVYGIVRHPQYLAGILLSIALPMIAQHWLVAALGAVAIVVYYLDTFVEERNTLEKFGAEYERYMELVPRLNAVVGIVRWIGRSVGRRGEDHQ